MRFAALLLALGCARAAADLSKQAYVADGATTYCRDSSGGAEVSILKMTDANTAGRCPLALSMGVTVKSYTMKSTIFEISWSASLTPNSSKILFPVKTVNSNVPIILPNVEACLLGSNCATFSDIVAAKPVGSAQQNFVLDPKSGKAIALVKYTLELPATGNYVVLGDASVSGMDDLISNTVFQHVRATWDGTTLPGTIKPPPAGFSSSDSTTTTTSTTTTPAPVSVENRVDSAQASATPLASSTLMPSSSNSTVTSSGTSHANATNALVVVALAVVGLILAGVLILVRRKRDKNEQDSQPARAESMRMPPPNHNHRGRPGPPVQVDGKPVPHGDMLADSAVMTRSLDSYGTRKDRPSDAFLVLNSTREDSFGSVAILDSSMVSSFNTNTKRGGVDFSQSNASTNWEDSSRSAKDDRWDETLRTIKGKGWDETSRTTKGKGWDDSSRTVDSSRWNESSASNRWGESSASNRWNDTSRSAQSNYWEESRRSDVSNHWVDTSRTDAGTDWLDSSRSGLDSTSRRGNNAKSGKKLDVFSF